MCSFLKSYNSESLVIRNWLRNFEAWTNDDEKRKVRWFYFLQRRNVITVQISQQGNAACGIGKPPFNNSGKIRRVCP